MASSIIMSWHVCMAAWTKMACVMADGGDWPFAWPASRPAGSCWKSSLISLEIRWSLRRVMMWYDTVDLSRKMTFQMVFKLVIVGSLSSIVALFYWRGEERREMTAAIYVYIYAMPSNALLLHCTARTACASCWRRVHVPVCCMWPVWRVILLWRRRGVTDGLDNVWLAYWLVRYVALTVWRFLQSFCTWLVRFASSNFWRHRDGRYSMVLSTVLKKRCALLLGAHIWRAPPPCIVGDGGRLSFVHLLRVVVHDRETRTRVIFYCCIVLCIVLYVCVAKSVHM